MLAGNTVACEEVNRADLIIDFVGFSELAKCIIPDSLSVTVGELETVSTGDCVY